MATLLVAAIAIVVFPSFVFCADRDEEKTVSPIRATEIEKTEVTPTLENMNSGVLRLLIWEGHAPQDHVSRFEKQMEEKYNYKVKLQISYVKSSDDIYYSIRSGNVDMVMLTHHHFKDERFNFIEKN